MTILKRTLDNLYLYGFNYFSDEIKLLKEEGLELAKVNEFHHKAMGIVLQLDTLRMLDNPTVDELEKANTLIYSLSVVSVDYEDMLEETNV